MQTTWKMDGQGKGVACMCERDDYRGQTNEQTGKEWFNKEKGVFFFVKGIL